MIMDKNKEIDEKKTQETNVTIIQEQQDSKETRK